MLRFTHTIMFLLGCALGAQILAQSVTFNASVSRNRVAVGEQFQLNFTVNASGSAFHAPDLSEFHVYSGPNQSTSMQYSNGSMSQSLSYYYILAPKREGKFTIGAASIQVGGKAYYTKSVFVEVVKGQAQQNPQAQGGRSNAQGDYPAELESNIFLKATINKNKAFIGEQLLVVYKIYTRVNIVDNGLSKAPVFNGFWSEDIPNSGQVELHPEVLDGIQYQVAELKRIIVMPQKAGTLTIEPMEMDVVTRIKSRNRSNSIFDQFFGGGYQDVKVPLKSNAIKVEAVDLPLKNRPADFSGATGSFKISSSLNRKQLKTNESVNLNYHLSGKGNFKLIEDLKPEIPSDIEVFDPKLTDKLSVSTDGINGSRNFEYLVIPRHPGTYVIPPVSFSYFDPVSASYKTILSESYTLTVEKGEDDGMTVTRQGSTKEEIKDLGDDIRYIKSNWSGTSGSGSVFYGSALFYMLVALPFLLLILFFIWLGKYEKDKTDHAGKAARKAGGEARKRLMQALQILQQNRADEFHEELYKAMNKFLSAKLRMPIGELNKENIRGMLKKNKVNETEIENCISLLEACEFARFAPVRDKQSQQELYDKAIETITSIDQQIK